MDENSVEHGVMSPAAPKRGRRGRKLTFWPDAVAMAATSITVWRTFMIALQMMIKEDHLYLSTR
jgi:hypothetical protein